jgi:ABC-type transport system involved in cytochrome c biogenesis permease subunit
MLKMSEYSFVAALLTTGLGTLVYAWYALSGLHAARMQAADPSASVGLIGIRSGPRTSAIGRYASLLVWLALAALLSSLVFRAIATGHGPFANMYEFSVAFSFGILAAYQWFEHRYQQRILAAVALPLALAMMAYAATIPAGIEPLVPALQNNLLLTVHVAAAIVAYGSFSVAFAASVLYLLQPEGGRWHLPRPPVLDEIGYRAVVIGFPFLMFTIIVGAVWAEVAWGSYWSWDPKETASLVTWLLYGVYLHARLVRGWSGTRANWLLVLGFAATLFTYFGNLFFGGLHTYAGLG